VTVGAATDEIVIVATPERLPAVMRPVELTFAIDVSLDVYVTPVDVPAGAPAASVTFDVICCVPPVWSVTALGDADRPETSELAGPTVIAALAFRAVFATAVAVMTAVRPAAPARAVTRPFASTVATVASDVDQVTPVFVVVGAVGESVTVATSWPEPPGTSVRLVGLTLTDVTGLAFTGADTVTGIEPVTVWLPLVIVKFTAPAPARST
jgi:hypothetical protein